MLADNLIANLRSNLGIGCGKGSSQIDQHIYVRLYDAAFDVLPQRSQCPSHPRWSLRGLSGIAAFVLRRHSSLGTATGSFKYFGPRVPLFTCLAGGTLPFSASVTRSRTYPV